MAKLNQDVKESVDYNMIDGDPKRFENDLKKFRKVFRARESMDMAKLKYFYGPHFNGTYKNKHFMQFSVDVP